MNQILKWYQWIRGLWRKRATRKPVWRSFETEEARKYRTYFSEKLLKHQIDTLKLYDPIYVATIPKDPETLKRIFPHEPDS
jgi:hypothetical protein